MVECLLQTHTEEAAAAALKASLPLVPLEGSLEICSEIGHKKKKRKLIRKQKCISSLALPSPHADVPWMAPSWLYQLFAALFSATKRLQCRGARLGVFPVIVFCFCFSF